MFWLIHSLVYIDGLVQEGCNSSVLAMELHLSCTTPSICIDFLSWIMNMLTHCDLVMSYDSKMWSQMLVSHLYFLRTAQFLSCLQFLSCSWSFFCHQEFMLVVLADPKVTSLLNKSRNDKSHRSLQGDRLRDMLYTLVENEVTRYIHFLYKT